MGTQIDALFSKTQQRVLALLFGQPDRSFYANEIIALAESGSGAVQRELTRLEAAGLVTVRRVGNQKHFQANQAASIYLELRGIVLKTFGMATVLRVVLEPIWRRIDVAFIYGSVAKGTDHAASDVDLLVVAKGVSNSELLEALLPAQQRLGRIVNPTLYGAEELMQRVSASTTFITRVMAQPKIFVKGAEHDLARFGGAIEPGADRTFESRSA